MNRFVWLGKCHGRGWVWDTLKLESVWVMIGLPHED
jgi:hypothetical protein